MLAAQPKANADISRDLSLVAIFANNTILTSAGLLTASVLYGVYLVLFVLAMIILCKEGIRTPKLILTAALVVLFLLSTAYLCCTMSYFVLGLKDLLINDVGIPLVWKNAAFLAKYRKLGVVRQVLPPIAIVIGDSIVIWRAWALSAGNKKIMFVPVLLQLALTVNSFAWVGCFVDAGMPTVIPETCKKFNMAANILPLLTNIAGTSVIAYTTWRHRKAISEYLTNCPRTRAEKVMVLLVESGVLYISLWIVQIAEMVTPSNPSFANQAFRQFYSVFVPQLVGLYPTAIVVFVFLQRSLWDTDGVPSIHLSYAEPSHSEPHASAEATSHVSLQPRKPETSHSTCIPKPTLPRRRFSCGSLPVHLIQEKKDGDEYPEGRSSPYSPYFPKAL
ncbi:hypothetical protein PM082_019047 [Marasmius tenuissimus]|nr:hypothetical protein PM082_019047 [Marasmius tenuissimus]